MERIEILRALAEARNAFNKVLENHGINHTSWNENAPNEYILFTQRPGQSMTQIAKIVYSQKIIEGGKENE